MIGEDNNDVVRGKFGGFSDDTLSGGVGDDTIYGEAGNDILTGGTGNDALIGGDGVDMADYSDSTGGVSVRLQIGRTLNDGSGGMDTLDGIENVTGSAFDDLLFGDNADNTLTGGAGRDILLGLVGNDILIGGSGAANDLYGGEGDDIYIVDANDTIVEAVNQGTDTVQTSLASHTLRANVENLTYTGSFSFVGRGNASDNIIIGGESSDSLYGLEGNDRLIGGSGAANTLIGGIGNDTYVLSAVGDSIVEGAGEGIDGIETSLARMTLVANVENLTFTAIATQVGIGNALDNVITGGTGFDTLSGLAGNDTLVGGSGAANVLIGGLGDDTYIVSANDTLIEAAGEGTDRVLTDRASLTLRANIENLTYTGASSFFGQGNDLDNIITGGAAADILYGLDGNDTLIGGSGVANTLVGGAGDDTYTVTANDTIIEAAGQGIDTVNTTRNNSGLAANVENLTFVGTGNFSGTGNALANVITGGTGADTLRGAGGNDTLNGGDGFDTADFAGLASEYLIENLGGGQYRVTDSVGGRDGIDILNGVEQARFSDSRVLLSTIQPNAFPELSEKDAGPLVLPGLTDDDFLFADSDLPLVLPGEDGTSGVNDLLTIAGILTPDERPGFMLAVGDAGLIDDRGSVYDPGHDHWFY